MRVLILGGTGEARALAADLLELGQLVTSSLAGRVREPRLPVGTVRIGGFGGVDGLAEQLTGYDCVIDATHPFAATITEHAAAACARTGIPLLVLRRPGWIAGPADHWTRVPDITDAAAAVAGLAPGCVFLTTGRRDLAAFAHDETHHFLVRTVDEPDLVLPRMTLLLARGPYTVQGEAALMDEHRVIALVTKDSGGAMTTAKLVAARERRIPVIMVDRPRLPDGVLAVDSVSAAVAWVQAR